jgi:hypothetical protein
MSPEKFDVDNFLEINKTPFKPQMQHAINSNINEDKINIILA